MGKRSSPQLWSLCTLPCLLELSNFNSCTKDTHSTSECLDHLKDEVALKRCTELIWTHCIDKNLFQEFVQRI